MDAKVTRGGNALTVEFENCGCKYVVVKTEDETYQTLLAEIDDWLD